MDLDGDASIHGMGIYHSCVHYLLTKITRLWLFNYTVIYTKDGSVKFS